MEVPFCHFVDNGEIWPKASNEINLTSMNDHLMVMVDVSKVAISGYFCF